MGLISKSFLTIALLFLALFTISSSAKAFNLFGQSCNSATNSSPTCQQAQNQGGQTTNKLTGTQNTIEVATNIVALITGIGAIIMIIISGLRYMFSGGSGESAKAARQTLTASIAGLVVVALAWTIVRFITDNLIK